jgi:hypothetical protein
LVSDISRYEREILYLVAKGLSGPGRKDDKGVFPSQDAVDGSLLFMAEAVVAEFLGQDLACEGQVWHALMRREGPRNMATGCDTFLALSRGRIQGVGEVDSIVEMVIVSALPLLALE